MIPLGKKLVILKALKMAFFKSQTVSMIIGLNIFFAVTSTYVVPNYINKKEVSFTEASTPHAKTSTRNNISVMICPATVKLKLLYRIGGRSDAQGDAKNIVHILASFKLGLTTRY